MSAPGFGVGRRRVKNGSGLGGGEGADRARIENQSSTQTCHPRESLLVLVEDREDKLRESLGHCVAPDSPTIYESHFWGHC